MKESKELDIKKENVSVGGKFSTVTKLYAKLELPTKVKGTQKIAQDKEIARHLKYELSGTNKRAKNEIIITEIYDTPLEKIDGRKNNKGGNNNKYSMYIDKMVLSSLIDNDGYILDTMNNIFVNKIQLLDPEWREIRVYGNKSIALKYNIHEYTLSQYCNVVRGILSSMFKSSLNRLQRQGFITWDNTYMVVEKGSIGAYKASEYEWGFGEKIKAIEEEVLEELELTRKQLRSPKNYNKFRSFCLDRLCEETDGIIDNYWVSYEIKLLQDNTACGVENDDYINLTSEIVRTLHKILMKIEVPKVWGEPDTVWFGEEQKVSYKPFAVDRIVDFVNAMDDIIFKHKPYRIEGDKPIYNLRRVLTKDEEDKIYQDEIDKDSAIDDVDDSFMELINDINEVYCNYDSETGCNLPF